MQRIYIVILGMEKTNWTQSEQLLANNIRRDNGVKTHNSCKEVQS